MNLSICNFSFQKSFREGKMDVFGYLETVKYRYHMDQVDLWNGFFSEIEQQNNRLILHSPSEDFFKKVREVLDEKGMKVINFAVDGAHLWDPDPDFRKRLHQSAIDHLRAAEIVGAQSVRIDTGGVYGNDPRYDSHMNEEQFEYIVKGYQEYCRRAAKHGYKVGPENHMGPSLDPLGMKKIAEAVDHPNFGVLLHVDRWKKHQEKGDEYVAPWVYYTHFDEKTATAKNALDKIRMLRRNGYKGAWGIEYNPSKNQYVEIEWLLATMKRLLLNVEQ